MQRTESNRAEQAFQRKERTFRFFVFSSLGSLLVAGYIFSWYLILPN